MRLIILLALLIGVLYCLHLLVRDYQAIAGAGGRLLRFFTKRDIRAKDYYKPNVRWRTILQFDPLKCARAFYCHIGAHSLNHEVGKGFAYMLTLEPREEDKNAHEEFLRAFSVGRQRDSCGRVFSTCPFGGPVLLELIQYLLKNPYPPSLYD